jgi:hypothetical protein
MGHKIKNPLDLGLWILDRFAFPWQGRAIQGILKLSELKHLF